MCVHMCAHVCIHVLLSMCTCWNAGGNEKGNEGWAVAREWGGVAGEQGEENNEEYA